MWGHYKGIKQGNVFSAFHKEGEFTIEVCEQFLSKIDTKIGGANILKMISVLSQTQDDVYAVIVKDNERYEGNIRNVYDVRVCLIPKKKFESEAKGVDDSECDACRKSKRNRKIKKVAKWFGLISFATVVAVGYMVASVWAAKVLFPLW